MLFHFTVSTALTASTAHVSETPPVAVVTSAVTQATKMTPMEEIVAAEEKKLALEWTPSQLGFLAKPYFFQWNPAAYFVVSATALVGAVALAVSILLTVRSINACRRKQRTEEVGTSYLMPRKPHPTTRLTEALRRGKISHPLRSEDGNSNYSGKRSGTEEGFKDDVTRGW